MKEKILIVEDHFGEASDLRIILETAGYRVTGIAESAQKALQCIELELPEMVLIDLFLSGTLTGIDLAKALVKLKIPFIYLSASSNQSTLEEVKATHPFGFLVKPFRRRDVLITVEIAVYRHTHQTSSQLRDEGWLNGLLTNIIDKSADWKEKLILLSRAFQPFIPFDYIFIDMDVNNYDYRSIIGLQRINFDEYSTVDIFPGKRQPAGSDLQVQRSIYGKVPGPSVYDRDSFISRCSSSFLSACAWENYSVKSEMFLPAFHNGDLVGAIFFFSRQDGSFGIDQIELLTPLTGKVGAVLQDIRSISAFAGQTTRPRAISAELTTRPFPGIVGESAKLILSLDQAVQVAPHDTSVLIQGETGTGKEGIVNLIHRLSSRSDKPLIKINCAAIPDGMIESELFGHEKGAFTGASDLRLGKFELAKGGTLFLDEIGELPLEVQSKLLRVLQEKEIERLGGRKTIPVDVRIVAATNRNLHQEMARGAFRMDLYYRINIFPIIMPPLRERLEDIPLLVSHFLSNQASVLMQGQKTLAPGIMESLMNFSWPGNIRQLQHLIERSVILTKHSVIQSIELPKEKPPLPRESTAEGNLRFASIEAVEKAHIIAVLKSCDGKIAGKSGAAEILQIPVTTLRFKMKKFGLSWQYAYPQE